jgi:lipopolysaccharide biosynthesis regulator YciM
VEEVLTINQFRTGQLLYILGNVYQSQGQIDKSFAYHQRGLLQFRATVGDNLASTSNACYKVAVHRMKAGDYDSAK